jgi:predicted extracellular nuclease
MRLSATMRRPGTTLHRALLSVLFLGACAEREPTALAMTMPDPSRDIVAAAISQTIVISQVYGGGGNTNAPYRNDYIELYNRGTTTVDVSNWSVQYAATTGINWQRTNLSGSIPPGGYYLVQEAAGASTTAPLLPSPDASGTISMAAGAGKVALVSNQTTITAGTICPTTDVVDLVGYGSTTNCVEGTGPTATISATLAAFRAGGGATDTDNNAADFTTGAPNPRNSSLGPPVVKNTTPATGATQVALNANVAITFNKPVTVNASSFGISCATSGVQAFTLGGSADAYTLDPNASLPVNELCTVTVVASQVAEVANPAVKMAADYVFSFTTFDGVACQQPFTHPGQIQGTGDVSPLAGSQASTQGVVVGDYESGQSELRGFFVQAVAGDGDAATSDAVFVFNGNSNSVSLGDLVRVTGTVAEFQGQTQFNGGSTIVICATGSITPTDVALPAPDAGYMERFEGMLVRFQQPLVVTEHFLLGRANQVTLSSGARLVQPTSIALPGAPALAVQAANDLNRVVLDDASQAQNPDPIIWARGGQPLSASNTLRAGDTVTGIVGVLNWTWGGFSTSPNAWRVRPINALGGSVTAFAAANQRPVTPAAVGGTLKVAAMNVLNYFNTFDGSAQNGCNFGVGGATTDCRGADDAGEFARQFPKTVAAIVAMDVDVLGVIEIENDGYGPSSAIADLTAKVNAVLGVGTYAYLDVDTRTAQVNALGTDAIKVGLLYKPSSVTPVGATAVLNTTAFVNGGDGSPRNRPALAQAFETPDKGRFVVSVNHLKSKSSPCAAPDAGDGQGDCAAVRTNAANLLRQWLATDPTGMLDPDVLIVGDMNAYAMEDAIRALTGNGYVDLAASRIGAGAYSYVFDGQWGYLDHALASSSLASQVTGIVEYHVNADEPSVLDYNDDFKTPGLVASLYAPDQYRNADHDPVIVGLTLTPTEILPFGGFLAPVSGSELNEARAGGAIPIRFGLSGDRGLDVFAPGYPISRPVACPGEQPQGTVEETDAAGQSGLAYDPSTDSYTYVWKTDRAWKGTCRELVLKLRDASVWTATFQFR